MKDALARTLLLMRADLADDIADERLLEALTATTVVLSAGRDVLDTHSGQTAFVTAAILMARSGHRVWLDAPEAVRLGAQPPITGAELLAGLVELGDDLLPDWRFETGPRPSRVNVAVTLGGATTHGEADLHLCLNAEDWSAYLAVEASVWRGGDWPIGGLAAGALAAAEAFKSSMRRLRDVARVPGYFDAVQAPCRSATITLADADTPIVAASPDFDFVSGGAIANAFFYAAYRLPGFSGRARVFDDDLSALTNLNRNALLRRSALDTPKVVDLARYGETLAITSVVERFSDGMSLRPMVLVGVDDIRSRWIAQGTNPAWLGVGATEGFNIQVSTHGRGQPCAGCLHPVEADVQRDIPTVAFVSFWSGLLLAVRWLRALAGRPHPAAHQQTFVNALRAETWAYGEMPVSARTSCPVACVASRAGAGC